MTSAASGHQPHGARRVIVGAGCSQGCGSEELIGLAGAALEEADLPAEAVAAIATLDLKAGEAAISALAAHFGVPLLAFGAARLEQETPRLATPSARVFAAVGCHSVCEGAALAAAGPGGHLVLARRKSPRAAIALATAMALPHEQAREGLQVPVQKDGTPCE
ncbi:cobalamin biosynthesis protein [Pannonibacter indicus]|uniref:cobalamin biosynthesis protein n=1 Tax=Pannonibacter indicus TaxID=466044 RepID=UPI0039197B79